MKFFGSLSPDNSVDGTSMRSRGSADRRKDQSFDPEDGFATEGGAAGAVGMIPFSSPAAADTKQQANANANVDVPDVELDNQHLNVSNIEKALTDALQAHDAAHAAQEAADMASKVSLESYEDEFFHLRPKIVQVWAFT